MLCRVPVFLIYNEFKDFIFKNNFILTIVCDTQYPLLRRLEKQEILISEWETDGNKPRKYYKRTPFGEAVYLELKKQWTEMTISMQRLFDEDKEVK